MSNSSQPQGDSLDVRPVLTAVLEHRTASSSCCGAKLNPGPALGAFACRSCGQPCERAMSEPREITVTS